MAHWGWIGAALLILSLHAAVRHAFPTFTPPATDDKPAWIRFSLQGEFLLHLAFLGAVITGIRNRIPGLKRPSYSDDGTLSITSSEPLIDDEVRWAEIGFILVEFAIYLATWAWVYGII